MSPTAETGPATSVTQTSATLNATVNPNGGEVGECKLEYGTSTSYGSSAPCTPAPGSGTSPVAVSASVSGLSPNLTYHFRVSATNASGTSTGADAEFKTPPEAIPPPSIESKPASSITQTGATLNATVNPNGNEVSSCSFEYGTDTKYGSTASCTPAPGAGSTAVAVSAAIAGLSANTVYHFRISATNGGGTSKGADAEFKTPPEAIPPPSVESKPASSITQTGATLNATVNPNGNEVSSCSFEYGTDTKYGSTASCTPAPGAGTSPVAVSAALSGLAPNTTYHFRVSATNAGGTSTGADETLKTPPNPPAEAVPTKTTAQSGGSVSQTPSFKVAGRTVVKPTVKVTKVKVSGNVLLITVELSQKGTVRVSGTGLKTTSKRNLAAGSHRIRVPLTRSGLAARKHNRKLIVHVTLTVPGAA